MKPDLILFGCGGHSRSVSDVILLNNDLVVINYIDEYAKPNEKLFGFPVYKNFDYGSCECFIAIGDNKKRKEMFDLVGEEKIISIISKLAHIGCEASISAGVFIGNYAHLGPQVLIGKNTIINTSAIVEHEVVVGNHSHIGPNATISGRCKIGDDVFIGVGAIIKDYISVCENVIVGAGATVVKDITQPGIYVGTPAKKIK